MTDLSYLLQESTNKLLDLVKNAAPDMPHLPNDFALSQVIGVSRTTVRTAVTHLCEKGVLKREGNVKTILRAPEPADYFDISNEPSTKEEQFEKYFLSLISSGKLLPGDRFSELDLAKKSNCITITVREFLIKFAHTGLIKKNPRAQWQMVEFDVQFAEELIAFRKILEMASIRALLERPVDDPVWSELTELLNEHKALLADIENKFNDFPALDARLHRLIQSASGNRFINQFFNIVTFICHYHYQWDKSDEKERNAIAVTEHINLLNNLLSRDIGGSVMSLEKHLNTAQRTLMRSAHGLSD
ncbi:GntR family transcriptional regulator [Cellvibrio zantedeschiae]|uniref:GntR family transcriptional regulator n=1 Tax=Cellvibrio zantedeschiae TaxID=1237077 RepID=A0ABQ3B5X5_9GAMM|nr:GntR family transcriptional regulator [Cellvibrio zantedeschiae]GGY75198.1 GntR family transcriptional regulator [Cellvibrio zantedeschiae]